MVRSEFNTLVGAFAAVEGQAYLTSASDLNALYNECISIFAERTLCVYNPKVTLTLSNGVAAYNLRDTAIVTTYRVVLPMHVIINNVTLTNPLGRPGPVSAKEFAMIDSVWSVSSGTPTRWTREVLSNSGTSKSGTYIRLSPAPNATVVSNSNNFVGGYVLPPDMSDDAHEVPLPLEYQRTAAVFTAARLIAPRSAGSSLEKMARLDGEAAEQMKMLMERAQSLVGDL